jgi:hypothetical protein
MKELGFSEGAAYNRIGVARAARHLPAILDALRSGAVHLAGLRVLVPHLDQEDHERLLAEATGKSKREIEEMAARLSPKAPVPDSDATASGSSRGFPLRTARRIGTCLDCTSSGRRSSRFSSF